MKILYLISSLNSGGAETQLIRIISNLVKDERIQMEVVSLVPIKTERNTKILDNLGVKYYDLGLEKGSFNIKKICLLIKLVNGFKPDVIHAHMVHANFLSRFMKLFNRRIKIINTIHGEEEFIGIRSKIYSMTDRFMDITTCCGKSLHDYAYKNSIISKNKLKLVYNGLDLSLYSIHKEKRLKIRAELNIEENQFVWLTIGRLAKVKNQSLLINSFSKLVQNHNNSILLIAGQGELESELISLTEKLKIKDKVRFLGFRDDVNTLLNGADAFVMSSNNEGLPLVLQEAVSVGLPLVVTDVGGCKELISNNGYLVQKGDQEEMTNCMSKLMDLNSFAYQNMRTESSKISELYNMERICSQWLNLYGL